MNQVPDVILSATIAMRQAMFETELMDWGDDAFQPRLERYLNAVEQSARLHHAGRFLIYRHAVRLLKNRLKMQRDRKADPEISGTPIPRPLFILGLPRTGTTLLHRLLACDPSARFIRLCEGLFPAPPPSPETWRGDERISWAANLTGALYQMSPHLASAHALDPMGPEECSFLLEHTFADLLFEIRTNVPAYSQWLHQHEDEAQLYEEFRSFVQHLGWRWPGQHWVFKAPRHLMSLRSLLAVFPNARIIWTHRDAMQVVPSMCSLSALYRRIFSDHVNEAELGGFWLRRLADGVTRAMDVRDDDRPSRYCDVGFQDLIADPVATVRRIYEVHGYAYTTEFEHAMQSALRRDDNSTRKQHRYSCEQFGLNEVGVAAAFDAYTERFLPASNR